MRQHDCVPQAAARAAVNIGAGAAPRRGPSLCIWLVERMRRCGRGAPTYPSFSLREASQRSEKSLMLSMKLASTRTLRARRSGTGPGRWVDLAYLKRSSTLRVTSGSAGRSSEAIFRHFWFPKTKRTLHNCSRCLNVASFASANAGICASSAAYESRTLQYCAAWAHIQAAIGEHPRSRGPTYQADVAQCRFWPSQATVERYPEAACRRG